MSRMEVKRDTWCRHRTPFGKEFKACKAGIDFHQFDGSFDAMPCLGENEAAKARCATYSGWTDQEIAEREEKMFGRMKRIGIIRSAIIAEHQGLRRELGDNYLPGLQHRNRCVVSR